MVSGCLEKVDAHYDTVFEQEHFDQWIEKLDKAEVFAFDTETTSLNYMNAELVGLSFAVAPGEAAYVPLTHRYPGAPEQLALQPVLDALKPLLEGDQPKVIGQNLKYDKSVLSQYYVYST